MVMPGSMGRVRALAPSQRHSSIVPGRPGGHTQLDGSRRRGSLQHEDQLIGLDAHIEQGRLAEQTLAERVGQPAPARLAQQVEQAFGTEAEMALERQTADRAARPGP
jgi:hypothetical protein